MAVDMDVSDFSALEAGLMIAEVVLGKGYIMVGASPSDFSAEWQEMKGERTE